MRRLAVPITVLGVFVTGAQARAGGHGSGGPGTRGGALGQVSAGLGRATGGSSSGGGSSSDPTRDHRADERREEERRGSAGPRPVATVLVIQDRERNPDDIPPGVTPPGTATLDIYVGAQKVHDSDGAFSIDAALVDGWARVGGSVTQFFERQAGRENLTLTVPSFTVGARIDDGGPTRVYLEVGCVGAKTKHDPVMDTSIIGAVAGIHLQHHLGPRLSLVGDAQVMAFEDDVRARAMRVGVKLGVVQASLRVFDFNTGPALYGPEVGLRF